MTRVLLLLSCLVAVFVSPRSLSEILLEIETATKVQFPSTPGKSYQVFSTANPSSDQWVALGAPQVGTGEVITFFHTTTGDQKFFFKVEETNSQNPPISGTPLVLLQHARLNLQGQNLSGLTLTNLDLNNFSFENAILNNADLRGSKMSGSQLAGASFTNANLSGANLSDVKGNRINFSGADLSGAKVAAHISGNFVNAILEGAEIVGPFGFVADLSGAKVRRLKAPDIQLTLINAEGLDFSGSDFSGAGISYGVSFVGANLTGVKFNSAYFSASYGNPDDVVPENARVRFDNANLTDADLTGAKRFYEAPGIVFKNTKMPDGTIRN